MREVIVEMPITYGRYRVVCQFGYNSYIDFAWWGHLEKQVVKKRFLWRKEKTVWEEIDKCWWSKEITSMEQLIANANKFYDEIIEMPVRVVQRAMKL